MLIGVHSVICIKLLLLVIYTLVRDVIDVMVPFQGHLPFAVVGSMDEVKVGNKMVKARQYPWGIVQGNERMVTGTQPRIAGSCMGCALSGEACLGSRWVVRRVGCIWF